MGKSLGNLIALEDDPFEMFGKIMSVSDPLLLEYFELATTLPMEEVKKLEKELKAGTNPRTIKVRLAKEIGTLYHGPQLADVEPECFDKVVINKQTPTQLHKR